MLKITFNPPSIDEQYVRDLCDGIIDVKFEAPPVPISCIATVNHDLDIEKVARAVREKFVFGKHPQVEIIEDDETLYEEHPEEEEDDENVTFNFQVDTNKNPPTTKQDGLDSETFAKILGMKLWNQNKSNDVILISDDSESADDDLIYNRDLFDVEDDDESFINDLEEIARRKTHTNPKIILDDNTNSVENLTENSEKRIFENSENDSDKVEVVESVTSEKVSRRTSKESENSSDKIEIISDTTSDSVSSKAPLKEVPEKTEKTTEKTQSAPGDQIDANSVGNSEGDVVILESSSDNNDRISLDVGQKVIPDKVPVESGQKTGTSKRKRSESVTIFVLDKDDGCSVENVPLNSNSNSNKTIKKRQRRNTEPAIDMKDKIRSVV